MLFNNVCILGLASVDAPHRISSAAIQDRLAATMQRLELPLGLLEQVAGIRERRYWDADVRPSDAAVMAACKLLDETGIDQARIGALINTSVCRDYVEPSTASIVHGKLGLPGTCMNFDLGNACLAFMDAMGVVGNMIERGQIEYGLIVDGEGSRFVTEKTIERMRQESFTAMEFRQQFATLTLGSGAAAMLLAHRSLAPDGHRFRGGITVAATEHAGLCRGQPDFMETDTKRLLLAGLELAGRAWETAQEALGWRGDCLDEYVLHQVSQVHTAQLTGQLGIPMHKVHTIFGEYGNIGPAAVPTTLAKAVELGRIKKGCRVGLLGIGSGLNCAMAEVVW